MRRKEEGQREQSEEEEEEGDGGQEEMEAWLCVCVSVCALGGLASCLLATSVSGLQHFTQTNAEPRKGSFGFVSQRA